MRRHACLLVAFLGYASAALAAEVETERMTSPEIRAAVAAGKTTIIIPTGGTEQNGAHMVTGKHNFIVRETARRIAERLGNALVAPVIAYVPEGDIRRREGHMAFPGSISVPPDVFAKLLEAAAASFAAHGFKLIVFLGDSGLNQAPQQQLAAALTGRWAGDGVRVLNATDYYAHNGGVAWLKAQGETEAAIGTHAGIADTSELLAIFPDGVRPDKVAAGHAGTSGDPARATPKRGQKLIDLKVAAAVREIEAAAEASPPDEPDSLFRRLLRWLFG